MIQVPWNDKKVMNAINFKEEASFDNESNAKDKMRWF